MALDDASTLLALTRRLLQAISARDWGTYAELCAEDLTCFEPESRGALVEGLPFHRYYFDLESPREGRNETIVSPHVRTMGDAAVVSYVRLVQRLDGEGRPVTDPFEETRVWQRTETGWKHVHFHRSQS